VRVVEAMLAGLDQAVVVVLCRLDVPDRLTRRTTVAALAGELGADAAALDRLLRYAAARDWVRVDRRGRVVPTRALRFLRRDHPGGWRAWVDFAGGDDVTRAVGALETAVRDGGDPFAVANGAAFFAWTAEHRERGSAFDAAMAAGARMHGLVLAAALDWSHSKVVCDVGGGTGELLATLLGVHAHLEGVVLDLPHVVARATRAPRLRVEAGDAFRAVPADCDTYLFVNVLHDWADDDAARLLHVAHDALPPSGRVVVVEHERRAVPLDDIGTRSDLLMLALTPGGRERTTAEFDRLAAAAGLRRAASVTLASGDRAQVFQA
jgi:SAM-dependent methyltransferase